MKKVLLTIIAGLAITVANAQNAANFKGFSASLGLGFNNVEAKAGSDNGTNNDWSGNGTYLDGSWTLPNNTSTIPQFEVAYTTGIKKNWLATVGVNYNVASINAGNYYYGFYADEPATQTIKDLVSIYVAPTYAISANTAFFAKASYNFGKVNFREFWYTNDTQSTKGFGYGVGVKSFFNNNVFLQASLDQVKFNEVTFIDSWDVYYEQNMKNTLTTLTLSVGYKF